MSFVLLLKIKIFFCFLSFVFVLFRNLQKTKDFCSRSKIATPTNTAD